MTAVKTRKLTDLYRKGTEVTIDDGEGGVSIWMQKLNPVESETAVRKANASRAAFLSQRKDHDSEEYLSAMNDLIDKSFDELVDFAAANELPRRVPALEAEFAEEKGWNKDDYLQGLYDAWEGGLKDKYALSVGEDEEPDAEAKRVYEEMGRYSEALGKRLVQERDHLKSEFGAKTEENLRDYLLEQITKMEADIRWMLEYRKCEVWLGVRQDKDHHKPYFDNRHEVDELEQETLMSLVNAYSMLTVDTEEGKDLPETPAS